MAYFPESIMPSRLKGESQDIKGNRFILSAADVNKHDEEIRAIQRVLGVRRPRIPAIGFSGTCDTSGAGGGSGGSPGETGSFTPGCLDSEKVDGLCPGESPPGCETPAQDVFSALETISDTLNQLRDDAMLMASGIVAVVDPAIPGADGKIVWPSDWPVTTLLSAIPDPSTDDDEELEDLSSVELDDVSGLPDGGGFVTIINDVSTVIFRSGNRNLRLLGYTSLATSDDPIYDQDDIDIGESVANKARIFGLGTNVEIMQYESIDRDNNLLLNVSRKQLGTSSTRHAAGDLVFKGRVSINVSPINYRLDRRRIDQIDAVLRSDGSVDLRVRRRDGGALDIEDDDDTTLAYAHYHAVLLRELEPLPPFDPGQFGNCLEEA